MPRIRPSTPRSFNTPNNLNPDRPPSRPASPPARPASPPPRPASAPLQRPENPLAGRHFAGYHGSNQQNINSISSGGFDPNRMGSGSGLERGPGVYATPHRQTAMDYGDSATQTGEVNSRYEPLRYPGAQGQPGIGALYSDRPLNSYQPGRDMAWGVTSSSGDPNGDRMPRASDTSGFGMRDNQSQLESVYAPHRFNDLRLVPEPYEGGPSHGRPNYPPYEY